MATVVTKGVTVPGANYLLDVWSGMTPRITTWKAGLLIGDPATTGDGYPLLADGTGFTEADSAGTNYDRIDLVVATYFTGAAASGEQANTVEIPFGTADGAWTGSDPDRVLAVGLFAAGIGEAGGDVCYEVIPVTGTPQAIAQGNVVRYSIGNLIRRMQAVTTAERA